jgi:hypothetical protein
MRRDQQEAEARVEPLEAADPTSDPNNFPRLPFEHYALEPTPTRRTLPSTYALRNHAAPALHSLSQQTMTTYDEYGVPVGAYSEPESLTHQAWRLARAFFLYRIRPAVQGRSSALTSGRWSFRRLFTLVNALVLLWWIVLYWGERGVFNGAVGSCHWDKWEDWVYTKSNILSRTCKTDSMYRKLAQTPTDSSSSPTRNS